MRKYVINALLHLSKWTGLFSLARMMSRRGLRILCYHGFSISDEGEFKPGLFMSSDTFRKRLNYLVLKKYPVIKLDDAVENLQTGSLPPWATVITFDDGFYSIWRIAIPLLQEKKIPGTIYVTSYYCEKEVPIFRLVLQYMFWKTMRREIDLTGLGLPHGRIVSIVNQTDKHRISFEIINYAEKNMTEKQRVELSQRLGVLLGVDINPIWNQRFLSIMNSSEICEATKAGIDIELHTHRHVLPENEKLVRKEIEDNRRVIEPLIGRKAHHLCFPDGIYSEKRCDYLKNMGDIYSATTCDPGLNFRDIDVMTLRRIMDDETLPMIWFEAEMSGFLHFARKIFKALRSPFSKVL